MNKPSTQRFAVWAVLVSLGWLSFLWINGAGLLFFFAAWFVVVPGERLQQVVPRRELLWMTCIMVAFVAAMIALKLTVAAPNHGAFERFLKHPATIIALWLLCLGLGFRGWRRRVRTAA